jgi:DNA-binding response OmpR family regulator
VTGSILIVEDDTDIAELMRVYTERDGLEARVVTSAEDARAALQEGAEEHSWDLILLDINLPGADGFELLQEIRRTSEIPVIIVTARQDETDAVYGLGAGADEYVTKPFSPRVLVARVRALLRRSQASAATEPGEEPSEKTGAEPGPGADEAATASAAGSRAGGEGSFATAGSSEADSARVVRIGELELNLETEQLHRGDAEIRLAPKEYALFRYLVARAGRPATPNEIYEVVWNNQYGDLSSVAVHVQRLRQKLEQEPSRPEYILTRHGYGYVLGVSPEVIA